MLIHFSAQPGMHERQLQRMYANPLFPESASISQEDIIAARQRDQQATDAFMQTFHTLVEEIAQLQEKEESQVLLDLKARLDQAFQACSTLPGDVQPIRQAILNLIAPIMRAVERGAGTDAAALAKLQEEDEIRALHFALLELPLAADLLASDSPITADALVPTLLSAGTDELAQVLNLFSAEQLTDLVERAGRFIDALAEQGIAVDGPLLRLQMLQQATPVESAAH